MDIDIFGGWDKHPSQDINNRRITNWYTMETGDAGRGQKVLMPRAGLRKILTSNTVAPVTIFNFNDRLYYAAGRALYSLTVDFEADTASSTLIGTLSYKDYRIEAISNTSYALFNTGDVLTFATNTVTAITDIDFPGAGTLTYMDGYFVISVPNTQTMQVSALNDPFSWNALDFANAEGSPDKLMAVLSDKGELLAFGKKTIEIWSDVANPQGFPFSRQSGAFVNQGISAPYSRVQMDNTVLFLDDRRYVVAMQGYDLLVLSNTSIKNEFASYSTVADAYAYQLQERGHLFYVITFPTANKTWAFDLDTKLWHQRDFTTPSNMPERDRAHSCVKVDNHYLVGDKENGNIYVYDENYYYDDTYTIRRSITSPFYNNEFNYIGVYYVELYGEFGKALQSGQGSDPMMGLSYSNDGGYTWSNEINQFIGKIGQYYKRVVWRSLGTELEWQFKLTFSEPIKHSVSEISAQFDVGI